MIIGKNHISRLDPMVIRIRDNMIEKKKKEDIYLYRWRHESKEKKKMILYSNIIAMLKYRNMFFI